MKPAATGIAWRAGDPAIRAELAARLERDDATGGAGALLQSNARRTLCTLEIPLAPAQAGRGRTSGGSGIAAAAARRFVIKTHHLATGRHRWREALKRRLGRSPAEREWRALLAFEAAGLPGPRPVALGRWPSGDAIVVCEAVEGSALRDCYAAADDALRDRLVARLADAIARLHASGWRHGDLHLGNLWVRAASDEIVFLDLQRARRMRRAEDRLRDLASLELSLLRADWPAEARAALRARLAVGDGFDTALRRFAADHVRGRSRRRLVPGRGLAHIRTGAVRGLAEWAIPPEALLAVVAAAERAPQRRERRAGRAWIVESTLAGRAVVVKGHVARRGLARLVDGLRGTRAARAFWRGSREQLLLGRTARPLAYLEQRRCGLPAASWLVLEHVGEIDLDAYRPHSPREARTLALATGAWLADLHALGWHHADLKGSNLRLAPAPDGATPPRLWLVDLEDLEGPGPIDDEARLAALAQLNASIPDAHSAARDRHAALARYVARLPFERAGLDLEGAHQEILRRSLARAHRFRGEACPPPSLDGSGGAEAEGAGLSPS